jgi:hypothetical protein
MDDAVDKTRSSLINIDIWHHSETVHCIVIGIRAVTAPRLWRLLLTVLQINFLQLFIAVVVVVIAIVSIPSGCHFGRRLLLLLLPIVLECVDANSDALVRLP